MKKYEHHSLENEQTESTALMKRTIKDSVFTNLFKDKKYLIQLYQALHPDDKSITENDIKDITINNILVDDIYIMGDPERQFRKQFIFVKTEMC